MNSVKSFFNKKNILLLSLISVVFWVTYYNEFDRKLDLNGDNIQYFSLGQAIHQGKGFTNIMSFEESPHSHFPPGYPFFISAVMKFTSSIVTIKFINGLLFFLSVLLFYYVFLRITKNIIITPLVCILVAMHPEMHRYATIMMSEMLFGFLVVLSVFLILKISPTKLFEKNKKEFWKTSAKILLLCLCLAYIYLVRTMGVAFLLAVIFYYAVESVIALVKYIKAKKTNTNLLINKHAVLALSIMFALTTLSFFASKTGWDIRNKNHGIVHSDYAGDFKRQPGGKVIETNDEWVTRIENNFKNYIAGYIPKALVKPDYQATEEGFSLSQYFIGFLIFIMILLGSIFVADKSLLIFFYLGATFVVLMVWPEQYAGIRYFVTLIPFILISFFNGAVWCLSKLHEKMNLKINSKYLTVSFCLLVFIIAMPRYTNEISAKSKIANIKSWETGRAYIGDAAVEFLEASKWVGKNIPADSRVSCRKPELFYMYSGYRKSNSFPYYGTEEDIFNYLDAYKIDYIIVDHWFSHAYRTVMPVMMAHQNKFKMVTGFGSEQQPTLIFQYLK